LKVVMLDESLEKLFCEHVNQEPFNHYFFILDWKMWREQTKIFLAMEHERIKGLMLVYRDYVVQLRGERGAVRLLLDQLSLEKVELQAPLECEDLVLSKYAPRLKERMTLMTMTKGEERVNTATTPVRLGVEDAEEIARIMREADPSWWGEQTGERLRERMKEVLWLGIKKDGRIVSVGMVRLIDLGSHIGVVATREEYRNRGYATSIVSGLVREIFRSYSTALIHVLAENAPAIHVYSKVGFKPYETYLSIRT
jgi:predicted GNAT family acetyltransferase